MKYFCLATALFFAGANLAYARCAEHGCFSTIISESEIMVLVNQSDSACASQMIKYSLDKEAAGQYRDLAIDSVNQTSGESSVYEGEHFLFHAHDVQNNQFNGDIYVAVSEQFTEDARTGNRNYFKTCAILGWHNINGLNPLFTLRNWRNTPIVSP